VVVELGETDSRGRILDGDKAQQLPIYGGPKMSSDTAGWVFLVLTLIIYTLVYRFISTGLVESLIMTINLGAATPQ
jgi:hypothetical protein